MSEIEEPGCDPALDDRAAEIERGLAGVREHYDNDWQDGRLAISSTRALAMAAMLGELAVRLRPGTDTGPVEAGPGFSHVAAELAWQLHNQRTRSADGYT